MDNDLITWVRPPLPGSYLVVSPVVAGPYPGGSTPEETRARLRRVLDTGFDQFVDLTEDGEREPYADTLPRTVRHVRVPLRRGSAPPELGVRVALDAIADAVARGFLVYVHDDTGIGRVGTIAGCLLAELGLAEGDALARLRRLRTLVAGPTSPLLEQQRRMVRLWEQRHAIPTIHELVDRVRQAGGQVGGEALYDPRYEREMRAMLVESLLMEGVVAGTRRRP